MSASPAPLVLSLARHRGSQIHETRAPAYPLQPGLSPQVRADRSLQLGLDPVHGVVLTGLAEHEAAPARRLIGLLAAASDPTPSATLACLTGLPETRVSEIVRALDDAGLTQRERPVHGGGGGPAWTLSRRRLGGEHSLPSRDMLPLRDRRQGARVVVDGRGDLVDDVARLLRAADVGTVRCGWYAGAGDELDSRQPDPVLVISIGSRLPRSRGRDWLRRSIAHLPVVARTASVDIGPLVVPGAGACLTCVQLTEGPSLLSHLGGDDLLTDAQSDPVRVEPSLAGIAAGTVAMLALGHIDAYPPPLGVRWHTALPLPSLAVSRWAVHPQCDALVHHRPRTHVTVPPGE